MFHTFYTVALCYEVLFCRHGHMAFVLELIFPGSVIAYEKSSFIYQVKYLL